MFLPRQIIALKKIVARVAGRFAACSTVRIERTEQGPRAMATDGRRAVVFNWDEPDAGPCPPIEGFSAAPTPRFAANIPPKALADASRGVARRTHHPALQHLLLDESNASVVRLASASGANVSSAPAHTEGQDFPDCHSVLPAPGRDVYDPSRHGAAGFTHTRIGVNAKQLAQTLQVVADLAADDTNNTVVMTVPVDPHKPLRLDARCPGRRAAAAVMPVHAELSAYDEPAQMQPPATALPPARKPRQPRKPQIR